MCRQTHVLRDRRGQQVGGLRLFRRLHRGLDVADHVLQVTGQRDAVLDHLDRRADSAAIGVTEHHQKWCVEVFHRVFEARKPVIVKEVAGNADHKKIARPLVEGKLRSDACVGAAQDRGDWILRVHTRCPAGRIVVVSRGICGITGVTLHQSLKRGIR